MMDEVRITRVLELHQHRLELERLGAVDSPEYARLFEAEQALLDELVIDQCRVFNMLT
jgi:hypothetical protein